MGRLAAEDLIDGLILLCKSGMMNVGQRAMLTDSAAMIKFQQSRVSEAERKEKEAKLALKSIRAENEMMLEKMKILCTLHESFRGRLQQMANVTFDLPIPQLSDTKAE